MYTLTKALLIEAEEINTFEESILNKIENFKIENQNSTFKEKLDYYHYSLTDEQILKFLNNKEELDKQQELLDNCFFENVSNQIDYMINDLLDYKERQFIDDCNNEDLKEQFYDLYDFISERFEGDYLKELLNEVKGQFIQVNAKETTYFGSITKRDITEQIKRI